KITEPAKLIEMYINTVYLQKENEALDERIDFDIVSSREDAKNGFISLITFFEPGTVPEELAERLYQTYIKKLRDDGEIEAHTYVNSDEEAVVKINYTLPYQSKIIDDLLELRSKLGLAKDDSLFEHADEQTIEAIEQLIKE